MGVSLSVILAKKHEIKPYHYLNNAKTMIDIYGAGDIYMPGEVESSKLLMSLDRPYVVMDYLKTLIIKHLFLDGGDIGTDCSGVGYVFTISMLNELIDNKDKLLSEEVYDNRKQEIEVLIRNCRSLVNLKDIDDWLVIFSS